MGARPGFVVTKRGSSMRRAADDDITVEVRVFAPQVTSSGRLKALLSDANVEAHVEIERIFGLSGGGNYVTVADVETNHG